MSGYDKFFKQARQARKGSSQEKIVRRPPAKGETPEEHIRAELARRMKTKRSAARRKTTKFPVAAALASIVVFAGCGLAYFKGDMVELAIQNTLGRLDIGFFGSAEASAEKADKSEKTEKPAKKASAPEAAKIAASTAAPTEVAKQAVRPDAGGQKWTAEELSFFGKLNERKKELDLREADLAKLDEELHKRKAELDEKLKQLDTMRAEISKTLKTRVASDHEKVDKLVQVYSTMKPAQASKIIETLDEDLAVEILDNMKKKNAAEILNMMDAKKARRLSELSTGYERSAASTAATEEKQ